MTGMFWKHLFEIRPSESQWSVSASTDQNHIYGTTGMKFITVVHMLVNGFTSIMHSTMPGTFSAAAIDTAQPSEKFHRMTFFPVTLYTCLIRATASSTRLVSVVSPLFIQEYPR